MKTYQIAVILAILVVGIIAVPVAATSGGQLANANVNGGKDNTAIAVNSNGDGALNVFQNQYNQIDVPSQSVSVTNDITFPTYVQDDMLDIGWLEENMSDISPRRDTARVFDIDDNTLQTAGMMFTFSYRSSDPVLVYGISSTDDDLAMSNSGSRFSTTFRQVTIHTVSLWSILATTTNTILSARRISAIRTR